MCLIQSNFFIPFLQLYKQNKPNPLAIKPVSIVFRWQTAKAGSCLLPRGSRTTHSERSANVTDGISRNRSDRLSASPRYFRHYYRGGPPIMHSAQCTPHYFEILDQETPSENAHPQRDFLPTAKGRASERPPSAAGVSYPSAFVLPSPPHPSARLRSRSAPCPPATACRFAFA